MEGIKQERANKPNRCVYLHINKKTNVVFYVGTGNKHRPRSEQNRSEGWHKIADLDGFYVEIVAGGLTWKESTTLEKEQIKKYGRADLSLGTLVNKTNGGGGVSTLIHTDETKRIISEKGIGRKKSEYTVNKFRESMLGHSTSEETRIKIGLANSIALKGKKLSEETKEKIRKKNKGRKVDPVLQARLTAHQREVNWNKGRKWTDEQREKIKNYWANRRTKTHRV